MGTGSLGTRARVTSNPALGRPMALRGHRALEVVDVSVARLELWYCCICHVRPRKLYCRYGRERYPDRVAALVYVHNVGASRAECLLNNHARVASRGRLYHHRGGKGR